MKIKTLSFLSLYILLCFVLLEIVSFVFLYSYSKFQIHRENFNYQLTLDEIKSPLSHPIFDNNIQKKFLDKSVKSFDTMHDPYLTYRLTPNESRQNIDIDKYGIVHNGFATNLKKDHTHRVIMFGGSTVEGSTGSPNNTCTIPSFVEKYLNTLYVSKKIQVINAGTAGSYSPRQLVQFNIEYVHIKPDLIISFEGFNDFWHYYPPSKDSGDWDNFTIPNRSRIQIRQIKSKKNKLMFKDLVDDYPVLTKYFWNTLYLSHLIINKIYYKDKTKEFFDPKINKDPWPHIARYVMEDLNNSYSHAPFFTNNWLSLKGSANIHKIQSLFFLQPAFPGYKKSYTSEEKKLYRQFYESRPHLDKKDVEQKFKIFYNEVINIISKYDKDEFVDLTNIFDDVDETIYLDIVHYLHVGNSIIAKEMLPYIIKKLNLPEKNLEKLQTLNCKF